VFFGQGVLLMDRNCRIALGNFEMCYEKVPVEFLDTFPTEGEQIHRFLFLTHTGHKVAIAPPNHSVLLKPGDHISLDGCVVAYDVEL
jgi:hypothetical protein